MFEIFVYLYTIKQTVKQNKMTTSKKQIVELGGLFTIMTTYSDGYTSPDYYPKDWKTRAGAEKKLKQLNSVK